MGQNSSSPPQTLAERRLRRQERRDKQRLANIGRAAKMHKARLLFQGRLDMLPERERKSHYIGCSGWFYWKWRGVFYPAILKTSDWFGHYARQFDTVEINASFYSWPTEATVKGWLRQAGKRNFIYTVKVCELITHIKRFKGTKTLIRDFSLIANLLGDRMGCFLFQLPPSYHYSPARLKSILEQLDHSRRNVVEFRHTSWWNEEVYAAFRKTGTIFCSCSGPRLPDALVKTADDIYIRFHGKDRWYRHDYSKAELEEWAVRIRKAKAQTAWIYFNNDYEGYAIKNAKQLKKLVAKFGKHQSGT